MAKPKKANGNARELAELGLNGVDTTKSKAPAYRRNRRKREILEILRRNLGNVSAAFDPKPQRMTKPTNGRRFAKEPPAVGR